MTSTRYDLDREKTRYQVILSYDQHFPCLYKRPGRQSIIIDTAGQAASIEWYLIVTRSFPLIHQDRHFSPQQVIDHKLYITYT